MSKPRNNQRFKLGLRETLSVLSPYLKRNFLNQLSGIWFIVVYLILFQILVLELPIVYAGMIAVGILIVALGLMFFMEGLRLGLMPLGEIIGSVLPRKSGVPTILLFSFLLGIGATFAEPAIAVLKAAGSGVEASGAPLLYSLLNDFSTQLVGSVGVGVGCAVMLGVLRFFYAWPLKNLAIPVVLLLLALSLFFSQVPVLNDVLGLAWDCGAVTTGPVTVPLVRHSRFTARQVADANQHLSGCTRQRISEHAHGGWATERFGLDQLSEVNRGWGELGYRPASPCAHLSANAHRGAGGC